MLMLMLMLILILILSDRKRYEEQTMSSTNSARACGV
jgi:hypothetical protein